MPKTANTAKKTAKPKTPKASRRPKLRRVGVGVTLGILSGVTDPLEVYILTGEKLATKPGDAPTNLGKLVCTGGGVDKAAGDKNAADAALRETLEEAGVRIRLLRIRPLTDLRLRSQTTGPRMTRRTFYLALVVGGELWPGSNELSRIGYRRIRDLLAQPDQVGEVHLLMIRKFLENGSIAKAIRLARGPEKLRWRK